MTEKVSESNQSTEFNDVLIYLLKGSVAGLLLSATFYIPPLFTEVGNETKAAGVKSQAQVKVDHYKELKVLAYADKESELFKTFNEKHKLNYNLAVNEVAIANSAISQASKNMDLITAISKLILIWSSLAFVLSGLGLIIRSKTLNKNSSEFTLKNNDVKLVEEMLKKEIKAVKSNEHIENKTIKTHKALFERISPKKSKEFLDSLGSKTA